MASLSSISMDELPKDALRLVASWFAVTKQRGLYFAVDEQKQQEEQARAQASGAVTPLTFLVLSKTMNERFLRYVYCPWENRAKGLLFAARHGHVGYFLLWSSYAEERGFWHPGMDDSEVLKVSIRNRQVEMVRALAKHSKINLNAGAGYAVGEAAASGNQDLLRVLLDQESLEPQVAKNYAIGIAACNGCLETLKLLAADSRVDIHDNNDYAARIALERERWHVVEWMKKNTAISNYPQVFIEAMNVNSDTKRRIERKESDRKHRFFGK